MTLVVRTSFDQDWVFVFRSWFLASSTSIGDFPATFDDHQVVAMTQKINAEKLLNVVVADQLKDLT